MAKNHYILLGGAADFGTLSGDPILTADNNSIVVWTVQKNARAGDVVLIYVTAPVSAICASGVVLKNAWLNDDPNSDWKGYYMAELDELVIFKLENRISIKRLRELFPDWRWLAFPRQNVRIPDEFLPPILELLDAAKH